MLPSTGYFKAIGCPFYESGSCDRPYCHFKHSKREDAGITAETSETQESRSSAQVQESKTSSGAAVTSDSDVLQHLVTEAVKKVLANREATDTDEFSCQNVVSQVVEGLKPTLASGSSGALDAIASNTIEKGIDVSAAVNKSVPCVYNPTPIAELKKRHIPIASYMPTRDSRIAVKRKCSPDEVKPWLSVGCEPLDSQTGEVKYKPTTIISSEARESVQSYIPTCKTDPVSSNVYNDGGSSEYLLKLREAYYPKSKKRREEYVPKKVKAPLKTAEELNDSTTLERFQAEFRAIDRIPIDDKTVPPDAQPNEEYRDTYLDVEAKFSDDEDEGNDDDDDSRTIEDHGRGEGNKTNDAELVVENATAKEREVPRSGRDVDCSNDAENAGARSRKTQKDVKAECVGAENREGQRPRSNDIRIEQKLASSRELSKSFQCEKAAASTSEATARKAVDGGAKERKSKDRNKSKDKDQKGGCGGSRCGSRGKGEKRDSSEKSRSTSDNRSDRSSKDRSSRSKHESKDSRSRRHGKDKSKDRDREKDRGKNREKNGDRHRSKMHRREHCDSERRREHDSKSTSESSRKQEREKRRNDERNRSKSRGKSHAPPETRDEKNSGDDSEEEDGDCIIVNNEIDDIVLSASDSDHDVQEECLKIFQEYQVPERPQAVPSREESESVSEKETSEEVGRKRVAHPSAANCLGRQIAIEQQQQQQQRKKKFVNPQQKMYERWRLMRDAVSDKMGNNVSKDAVQRPVHHADGATVTVTTSACNSEAKLNGRVRIAHVPYAKSLAMEKRKVTENIGKSMETKGTDNCKTAAQTTKSGVRVAHVPQAAPQLIRPEPLQVATQKFPLNVRQYYLNMMHDVCVQIYTNSEDAAQRAVKEEYACQERCKALAVYKNSCMLAAHRLRKEVDQSSSMDSSCPTTPGSSMVSHEAVLTGKSRGSWSVLKTKKSVTEFRGAMLYGMLKKWIMTEQQLRDNGFPRPHPDAQKGRAKVYVTNTRNQTVLSKVPNERICSRCGQAYAIDKQGLAVRPQNCIYHWGRKFTIRGEGKYSCCQQYGSATGCCDAKTHVWDYTDYENLRGYVTTLPKDEHIPVEEQGVYALDCEMCYTTQGLELTRITVVDQDSRVVYETLVKPQNPIIDYNTRFSGITEDSMKDVTTTLLDVQATMLTMFSEKTILVGHSLESDFKALKLLHDTVVDTSVVFPHKNGYPQKRALKNLSSEYLRKIIQNDVGGHDSKEDAVACMELILWKVKEEAKLQ